MVKRVVLFLLCALLPLAAAAQQQQSPGQSVWWWLFLFLLIGLLIFSMVSIISNVNNARNLPLDDEEGKKKSNQKIVIYSVIGVLSVLGMIIMWWLAATPSEPVVTSGGTNVFLSGSSANILKRTFPQNGQEQVPRNTSIILWFGKPLNRQTIIDNRSNNNPSDDVALSNNIKLRLTSKVNSPAVALRARSNEANDIIIFDPAELLGTTGEIIGYTLEIKDIETSQGQKVFGARGIYKLQFTVGPSVEYARPKIISLNPDGKSEIAPNSGIQWVFSKAIDPISAEQAVQVSGSLSFTKHIASQEEVLEVFPKTLCAQNQCRKDVYCWPLGQNLTVSLVSPGVNTYPPQGIRDFFGNSLEIDNNFKLVNVYKITEVISRSAPTINAVRPRVNASGALDNEPIEVDFSQAMSADSLSSSSVFLRGDGDITVLSLIKEGVGIATVRILHDPLKPEAVLTPVITSDATALNQQCFLPCHGP